jgi:hypothetical protein
MTQRDILKKILEALDHTIESENQRRRADGSFGLPVAKITILGQFGLMSHPDKELAKLSLVATLDVDAWIEANEFIRNEFRRLLAGEGFEYDDDSEKIWVPKETTYTEIFTSARLSCEVIDPIFSLVSKAIKAKEKNRILIRQALSVYGERLRNLILKYGGDCAYFESKTS